VPRGASSRLVDGCAASAPAAAAESAACLPLCVGQIALLWVLSAALCQQPGRCVVVWAGRFVVCGKAEPRWRVVACCRRGSQVMSTSRHPQAHRCVDTARARCCVCVCEPSTFRHVVRCSAPRQACAPQEWCLWCPLWHGVCRFRLRGRVCLVCASVAVLAPNAESTALGGSSLLPVWGVRGWRSSPHAGHSHPCCA
jgi:hypothetical protein